MADIPGINVVNLIVPTDDADTYPTHDTQYGKGDPKQVADTTARDAIETERRTEGMTCYTIDTGSMYQLRGGIANGDWADITGGSSAENTYTISPSGAEYTTIQAALTANATSGALFLVYPGTYANDTINFTANNQTVVGVGKPNQTIITNASQVLEAEDFTSCAIANLNIQFNPTTAINGLEANDGSFNIINCKLTLTTSSAIGGATQPALIATTGTGTIKTKLGEFYYYHTGNTTTGIKAMFSAATGSTMEILRPCRLDMTNSGTALATTMLVDAGTAVIELKSICESTITDTDSAIVAAMGYIGGSGENHFDVSHINVVGGGANACYAIFNAGTGTVRSSHNDFTVTGGATNQSFFVGASATITSHFDDIVAADGYVNSGTLNMVNSPSDGNLEVTGDVSGVTIGGITEANLVDKSASETIAGEWTYSTFPITPSAAPDADYEVANKKYVDDNAGGSVDYDKIRAAATCRAIKLRSVGVLA